MAYLRFLTNKDYCSIATEEHMRQIIRDVPDRIEQAESYAEMNMLEHLDQYYEIEKVLAVGKNIREYNYAVTYPSGVWVIKDGDIFRTLTSVNGYKKPTKKIYWRQVTEVLDPCIIERAKKYSQLRTYAKGDVVRFGTEYWICLIPHGYESDEIHMPGISAWKEVEVTPWEPFLEWHKNDVCLYEGNYYQYLKEDEPELSDPATDPSVDPPTDPTQDPSQDPTQGDPVQNPSQDPTQDPSVDPGTGSNSDPGISLLSDPGNDPSADPNLDPNIDPNADPNVDPSAAPNAGTTTDPSADPSTDPFNDPSNNPTSEPELTPEDDEAWGLIGEYSKDLEYDFSEDAWDYVVAEDAVFYPVINPNADELILGSNIMRDDPRNPNVVTHMARIALYYLHQIISPTNISETRRWAYEDSMRWLHDASKFKINPQLPRKKDCETGENKVDWALATYMKSYDPNENAWLI